MIETKFFVPLARPGLVGRPRLDELLSRRSRLTLVSAPAGFGKTTLLASWLGPSASAGNVAWVSLDALDTEAASFWSYVLTAVDRAAPGSAAGALTLLGTGQPVEAVLTALLNELSVQDDELVLVLDDYHLAESPQVQPGMSLLLERLPPQVRLVILTRADPALPLARLRARGELTEVRAADLRFTDAEASAFLVEETGLDLGAQEVSALGQRTEGWIASLQLAAISLRARPDPSGFIASFAGDDRYVMDYLVEEVLSVEPPDVRDFLLRTSILDRLSGPLCEAVTGTPAAAVLDSLEKRNLFLIPLDDQRRWYRYHHLFADVLRAQLAHEGSESVAGLHRRASSWFAAEGHPEEAVRHALAAGDLDRAAELVELAVPELRRERREGVLSRWARELPPELLADRPVLAVGLASGLMASNDFDGVAERLDQVDEMLARPLSDLVVHDEAEFARLPAALATYRAGLALVAGDLPDALGHAQLAESRTAADDDLTRSAAAGLAGLANWAMGDISAAHDSYVTCARGLARAGHIADVLGCSLTLADMELALGRLLDAQRTLEHALRLAAGSTPAGAAVLRGTADMLVGLSRVAWHRNDLAAAGDLIDRAQTLGESAGLPQHPYRWRVALARLRAAAGDHASAIELLDEAERVYVGDFSPQVHPIHATRARLLVAAGDLAAAHDWAHRHGVRSDDELSYLREYEHLTLARILLADSSASSRDEAVALLGRLSSAAADGGRLGTVIEAEAVLAGALEAVGDPDGADRAFERALGIGEPDRWIRVFADAGPDIAAPLSRVAADRASSSYVRELVEACSSRAAEVPSGAPAPQKGLVDPLSERELEVLRLLASELDGPGIARELVVSLNTVRTHTKHIYTKLDVNNRRQAVARAHQLGVLSRSH